jgi:hypothetical protein
MIPKKPELKNTFKKAVRIYVVINIAFAMWREAVAKVKPPVPATT